jgi:ubiquinone/menaquinone biosynthesis C-methylase UbiE
MADQNTHSDRTNQFLQEAYGLVDDKDMQLFYSNWADEYDAQLEKELNYLAPEKLTALFKRYEDNRDAKILDIGCGTGLTSVDLAKAGYRHIDGLDFSAAMLDKARGRNFYTSLIEADLNRPLAIGDNEYHAAICLGTFTHGHIGAGPLDEIFRIIKPGGYLVCTIHRAIWSEHGFEEKIDSLNQSGQVRTLEMKRDVYFKDSAPDGMYYVLQKC